MAQEPTGGPYSRCSPGDALTAAFVSRATQRWSLAPRAGLLHRDLGLNLVLNGTYGVALYFLPSIVGFHKQNAAAIFILNLTLGWTVIGWVVSLLWALTKEDTASPIVVQATIQAAPPACPGCHAVVNVSDVFCTRCGNKIPCGWHIHLSCRTRRSSFGPSPVRV